MENTPEKKKKNPAPLVMAAVALVLLVALMVGVWQWLGPKGVEGSKVITVDVTHGDGTTKTFTIGTDAEFLGEAMTAEGLLEGEEGPYGLYVKTVDGETVDDSMQEWWGYTKDGEYVEYGVDMCPIADGEHYEFTFNVGYDF